jgi:hypothetical protein
MGPKSNPEETHFHPEETPSYAYVSYILYSLAHSSGWSNQV